MSTKTEPLTNEHIRALQREASAAGDADLCDAIAGALYPCDPEDLARGREAAAEAINNARAMDDETPFVRVVP